MRKMDKALPIDESEILYTQQILNHVIIKNRPRRTTAKSYAKTVGKYIKFFNDIPSAILARDNTILKFMIAEILLRELKWVLPDDVALLVHDALCSANDDFKVDLKKNMSLNRIVVETSRTINSENTLEPIQEIPAVANKAFLFDVSYDLDETQFNNTAVISEISKDSANQKNVTTLLMEQNGRQATKTDFQNVQDKIYIPQAKQQYSQRFSNSNLHSEMKRLDTSFKQDTNAKHEMGYFKNMEGYTMDPCIDGPTNQQLLNSTFIDEREINSELGEKNYNKENEPPEYFKNPRQQPESVKTNRVPKENQIILKHAADGIKTIYSESKFVDFYPLDTDDLYRSQLGKLLQEEIETNFLGSLNWDSINVKTETMKDELIVLLRKFYHVANQFTSVLNSKIFPKLLNSFDQLVLKTNALRIKNDNLTNSYPSYPTLSTTGHTIFNPNLQWDREKEQKARKEETLNNLLQTIFEYLDKILNDFSKLHSTVFNCQDFLVKNVFSDIEQYFDERSECINDSATSKSLNICCRFIKTAIDSIFASHEVSQFLKWEEQCFLLAELCNSKLIGHNILEFLLDRTIAVLENLKMQNKNQNEITDPSAVEKLGIIFPMLQSLVQKSVNQASPKTTKVEDENNKADTDILQLWRSQTFVEKKSFDSNVLQDFHEEKTQSYTDKCIQDIEKIMRLTEDQLPLFSYMAQESLRVLRESKGDNEIKYSFSESETSDLNE